MITFDCVGSNPWFKTLSGVKRSMHSGQFKFKDRDMTWLAIKTKFSFSFDIMKKRPQNDS